VRVSDIERLPGLQARASWQSRRVLTPVSGPGTARLCCRLARARIGLARRPDAANRNTSCDRVLGCGRVQLREDLAVLGESPGSVSAVNELTVSLYVEDPAAAPDQFDLDVMVLLDRGRQTGGCRLVVSFSTVLDADFHAFPPNFLLGIVAERLHIWYGAAASRANRPARTPPGYIGSDAREALD